jgi:hypothetical protein
MAAVAALGMAEAVGTARAVPSPRFVKAEKPEN